MVDMEDRWLSVAEMSKYLGVSSDTVYRWISERNMPGHKIGRLWKFRQEEVDVWMRSGGGQGDANEKPVDEPQ